MRTLLISTIILLLAGVGHAGIIGTYVDADASNTVATDGGTWNSLPAASGDDADNLWWYRTDFSEVMEGGGLWVASNLEDPPQLTTTISGLNPGDFYDIRVVFVGHTGEPWNNAVGLASDSLTEFFYGDGVSVETGPTAVDGVLPQLQAYLGKTAADANGEIDVFIDRLEIGIEYDDRAWYDGVSYEPSLQLLPGDANYDGVVNAADAAIVADNWMTATGASWGMGDFNKDEAVDDMDATILATNWQAAAAGGSSVPEPSTLVLLACGLQALLLRRRS